MVTRYVHLEVAIDLSASSFLNLFRRFVAARSLPQVIYSDHGTNLSATSKFLKDMLTNEVIQNYMIHHQVTWNFIHVRSPWEGGFYERLIGVTKGCLRKLLYRKVLDAQELTTVVAEVQARINNRPLTYVSSEQQALQSLTPNHLMIGRRIITMPPLELEDDLDPSFEIGHNLLNSRYSHLSRLIKKFEAVFHTDYLIALRARHYGNNPASTTTPLQVGNIVLVESTTDRERWPLGRITQLLPDTAGVIRAVKVYSGGNESVRTLGKLVPMELSGPAPPSIMEAEQLSDSEEPTEEGILVSADEGAHVPRDTAEREQRPRRAAALKASNINQQLFLEDRA